MQKTIKHVGIVGGGELGQALARALHRRAVKVQIFDIEDDRTTVATIAELVHANQVLLLCIPSWATRDVAKRIAKAAGQDNHRVVVSFSKGVEDHFVTMDKVLSEALGESHIYGLAYGPMDAEELAVGRHAAGVLALSDMQWFTPLQALLAQAKIGIEPSNDLEGLAICGVLKNVYAIAFGMNDGMHLGDNMKGKLLVMVLREMKHLLIDLQVDPQLAESVAGIGDLVASGITDTSFNYRVGKTVAEGIADEKVRSEGLVTLKHLVRRVDVERYPILAALDGMLFDYKQPVEFKTLLQR